MYGFGELVICEDESEVGGRSGMKLYGKALVVVMVLVIICCSGDLEGDWDVACRFR